MIPLQNLSFSLKKSLLRLFKRKSSFTVLSIGILNGLLPCGLVYMALAGAVAMGDILQGGAYMALFGLGTLPMMLGISLAGNFISQKQRRAIFKFVPVFTFILAIWLIVRGLGLDIPYFSPQIEQGKVECCHQP
jgi:uncharacterized protein